jgi:hypothetical protein
MSAVAGMGWAEAGSESWGGTEDGNGILPESSALRACGECYLDSVARVKLVGDAGCGTIVSPPSGPTFPQTARCRNDSLDFSDTFLRAVRSVPGASLQNYLWPCPATTIRLAAIPEVNELRPFGPKHRNQSLLPETQSKTTV